VRDQDEVDPHEPVDLRDRYFSESPELDAVTGCCCRIGCEAGTADRDGARCADGVAFRGELLDPGDVLLRVALTALDGHEDVGGPAASADARIHFSLAPGNLAQDRITDPGCSAWLFVVL